MFFDYIAKVIYFSCITCIWSLNQPINLECSTSLNRFQQNHGLTMQKFFVQCNCQRFKISRCYVVGTGAYTPSSSICCGGIHSGIISLADNKTRMILQIFHQKKNNFVSSFKNGIRSRNYSPYMQQYFKLSSIPPSFSQSKMTTFTAETTSKSSNIHQPVTNNINFTILNESGNLVTDKILIKYSEFNNLSLAPTSVSKSTPNFVEAIPLIIGISATAALLVFFVFIVYRCRHLNCQWVLRIARHDESEPCVCYVRTDTSSKSLLNDPETCDRPCSVRLAAEHLDSQDFYNPDVSCNECASKYDF